MKMVEEQRSGQLSKMYWKDGKAGFIGKGKNVTKIQLPVLQVWFAVDWINL